MRCAISILVLMLIVGAGGGVARAATTTEVSSVVTVISADSLGAVTPPSVQCLQNSVPVGFFFAPRHPDKVVEMEHQPVDALGRPLDLASLTAANGNLLNGAGFRFDVIRADPRTPEERITGGILCIDFEIVDAGTNLAVLNSTRLVLPGERANITAFCPSGSALGNLTNGGASYFVDFGSAPVWGSPAAPLYLGDLPDGTTEAPTGWEFTVQNFDGAPHPMTQIMLCGHVSGLATRITSAPTRPGTAFTLYGQVPDTHRFVNYGFDGGLFGVPFADSFAWFRTGRTTYDDLFNPAIAPNPNLSRIDRSVAEFVVHGVDARQPSSKSATKATARAVLATLIVPRSDVPPAPTSVTIVEFFNQTLNHYFITADAQEISDLDRGVHPGWQRTGEAFKGYAVGSTGRTGRQPVCRAYGNPAAGLDSHFYSASIDECYVTLSRFDGVWLLEASEVFEMDLPDPATGACPAGDVPIYRVFNNRADANHRYTSNRSIRDRMVASGFIAEGYGPDVVTLCGLP